MTVNETGFGLINDITNIDNNIIQIQFYNKLSNDFTDNKDYTFIIELIKKDRNNKKLYYSYPLD